MAAKEIKHIAGKRFAVSFEGERRELRAKGKALDRFWWLTWERKNGTGARFERFSVCNPRMFRAFYIGEGMSRRERALERRMIRDAIESVAGV